MTNKDASPAKRTSAKPSVQSGAELRADARADARAEPRGVPRTAVVTGASGGIGYEIARGLLREAADVWVVSRPGGSGDEAVARLNADDEARGKATFVPADLSSLSDVRRLGAELSRRVERLDVLVNNAGAYVHQRDVTEDGFERTFALNHLAPFLLTHVLAGSLLAAEAPRVVTTSSNAERMGAIDMDRAATGVPYSAWRAYGMSKQANIHFARELARRAPHPALRSYAFHPGFVNSGFGSGQGVVSWIVDVTQRLFGRSSVEGADTGLWLATAQPPPEPNGGYFVDREATSPSAPARDDAVTRELWERSEEWVGLGADERLPAPGDAPGAGGS